VNTNLPEPQITLRSVGGVDEAHREWKSNCGPAAIAAALSLTLDDVRTAVPPMGTPNFKGFMNVLDVQNALRWLDAKILRTWSKPPNSLLLTDVHKPGPIVAMLQWGGPWNGIPQAAATYRHLVAFKYGWLGPRLGPRWLYDVNDPNGWCYVSKWERDILPGLLPERGDGTWSIAWACQVEE
jgi:hypothetical protein